MDFVLFDHSEIWKGFLPLTFTRPLSEMRIGVLTIKEKWDLSLNTVCSYYTQEYLQTKFKTDVEVGIFINSKYSPDTKIVSAILTLKKSEALYKKSDLIAFHGSQSDLENNFLKKIEYAFDVFEINNTWDIFQKNAEALKSDFELLTKNKTSVKLSKSVTVIGNESQVFLEDGAKAEACIFNTSNGPIYIGKDAEVMEGSIVRGPFALCEHSTLKMGAKIYGATTIGPHCKVGGEVSNSVIFGYTNKAHDGFLGNSIIGEWCNLGADTNTSNLKNNYGSVKLFSYKENKQIDTGLQFCGLVMGDHSKAGINTMFNTGTVVGIGSNIYGGGFPKTAIPNFSWGGSEGFENYRIDKLFETAEKVFERRGLKLNQIEKDIISFVYKGGVKL
ncbi:GlmU family protein [Aurantibacillus circumpalustris]|uniref:GlmU family protein n=1 Tax=Aurantibacillus circumpalustris TaxID=3036359 RepID=UPI00295BCA3F|nr:GlmU family protein [Aurantibacillus circumpalustris]